MCGGAEMTAMNERGLKKMAGEKAVEYVKDGMVVGLGTGSTVYYSLIKLGELVREGLEIIGIPTSVKTEKIAREHGIPLSTLDEHPVIDVDIDGADEVTDSLNLIKGLGGALVREKIVARNAKKVIVVADESKIVKKLGEKAPVPVELVQFGRTTTEMKLKKLGAKAAIRTTSDGVFVSDNSNYIIDCTFDGINDPAALEKRINDIEGVVDNGLFLDIADVAVIGTAQGTKSIKR
jgi:ribose 5-phosphate isomerase A